jgi:hypothetical protein
LDNLEIEILEKEKDRLYNIKSGGYKAPPVKHTEEAKRKIGEFHKVPVIGMSIKTGKIKEYSCGKDTALDGFNPKNIGKCCHLSVSHASGRTQQAISTGKWVWMLKSEFNLEEMKRRVEMAKSRGNNNQSRAIIGKSILDGTIINFKSCLEAGREMSGSHQAIHNACKGRCVKSHKMYVWVFADEIEATILLEKRYLYAKERFNGKRVVRRKSKH